MKEVIYKGYLIKLRRAHRGWRYQVWIEGWPPGKAATLAEAIQAAQREIDYALSVEDVGELID